MTDTTNTINQSRPKAESTNNQSSIINHQWKGEPNFNQRLVTIHQRLMTINMQNEPNFNPNTLKNPINHSRPQAESTNNQSSIINYQWKGEPNFSQRATRFARSNTQTVQILPPILLSKRVYVSSLLVQFYLLFYYFYALFLTFLHVFKLLHTNTLKSIYSKDLHKYFTCLSRR
jgi:hypothetical protein